MVSLTNQEVRMKLSKLALSLLLAFGFVNAYADEVANTEEQQQEEVATESTQAETSTVAETSTEAEAAE